MPRTKVPCTCRDCKLYWTYIDEHNVERPGRLRDPKIAGRHKRRDQYYAALQDGEDALAFSPETSVLLATLTDPSEHNFEPSLAVRPRDEASTDVSKQPSQISTFADIPMQEAGVEELDEPEGVDMDDADQTREINDNRKINPTVSYVDFGGAM